MNIYKIKSLTICFPVAFMPLQPFLSLKSDQYKLEHNDEVEGNKKTINYAATLKEVLGFSIHFS